MDFSFVCVIFIVKAPAHPLWQFLLTGIEELYPASHTRYTLCTVLFLARLRYRPKRSVVDMLFCLGADILTALYCSSVFKYALPLSIQCLIIYIL